MTRDLVYKNAHVLISGRLGDTLDRGPMHICDPNPNPKELIKMHGRAGDARTTKGPGLHIGRYDLSCGCG